MVVLAAAVLSKSGKVLFSRQFVEMIRIRIEGLLSAFPKLMDGGKQYTYFETDTVRYLYQPIESLFLVLITNRSSNIVEDLETLRLLGRLVPEHCSSLEEEDVLKNVFKLLFAFDEVIQMGYRDAVTVEQVQQFLEMDSQTEKIAKAEKEKQIEEAKDEANKRAVELRKQKKAEGGSSSSFGYGGISSIDFSSGDQPEGPSGGAVTTPVAVSTPTPAPSASRGKAGGMALGKKGGKEDLVSRMMKAGEIEESSHQPPAAVMASATASHVSNVQMETVHLKVDEKINAVLSRDGGFESLEVKGDMFLTISDSNDARVKVLLNAPPGTGDYAWKTHPNINKPAFTKDRVLALKDLSKPFPTGTSLGIVRWRLQNLNNFVPPITVNCWPSDQSVTIEYECEREGLVLNNVVICIPVGGCTPNVESADFGSHNFDPVSQQLFWVIDQIDDSNQQGSLEFSLDTVADPSTFFPMSVNFFGESTIANIEVTDVISNDHGGAVKYSTEVVLSVERYEVV